MADLTIQYGCRTAQGVRPNNEDRYFADPQQHLFLVADGMGGQEFGEQASGLAAEIIPRIVHDRLAAKEDPGKAMQEALAGANQASLPAGRHPPAVRGRGRTVGTAAAGAVQGEAQVYGGGLGDSRAYLVRGQRVEQLTVDHSVAKALELNGTLTAEQARSSPWQHVLYKFLGCAEMTE